ncbi:4'-phosphopantetheinyl transferase [Flavobacterium aquicola]|uniref:4'-phosphopantetheinyl transferase n=2 Tax=Flavobacterium aquicola TaxID=1682742 RepID=A0A3E0EVY1_9FLAO|nr:4'-phosphopantetheinyl transferase [Flavobacterium aquicola]
MQTAKLFISFSDLMEVKLNLDKECSLDNNDVIIYSIYLPNFMDLKADLVQFLNAKELIKAERFYKEIDQNRFIIYRSILKFILAAHTKLEVKNIDLDYHLNKKPYLASHPWLHFNISHSEDFAAIAVSYKKVGIDIEYMSGDFDFTNILPDIFDDNEIFEIKNAFNKKQAFYTSWTRKEAFVKALGKGIDEDFKYIPCLDGQHNIDSILLKNKEDWQMYSFALTEHYLGAVAFEGSSAVCKNLMHCSMPNTMKDLLEMTQMRNG